MHETADEAARTGFVRALEVVWAELADDYHEYVNGALVRQSRDEARAADQALYAAVPDYRRGVDELFASETAGAMRWRFLGTGPKGPFEVAMGTTYKVENDKILESWIYFDPARWAEEFDTGSSAG